MDICSVGVPTFQTRVEAWECDHNQHWNVRQYMRCFQQAGFVAADMCSDKPAPDAVVTQHSRYHRELLQTAPVLVCSAVISDGQYAGTVVHILSSEGSLSATALDFSGYTADGLPEVSEKQVALALPRGIADGHMNAEPAEDADSWIVEHGFVQPRELDHTGSLAIDWLMGRIAAASNDLLNKLGFTPDFVKSRAISRMGVETKITRFGHLPAGTRLRSVVRISHVGSKNIVLRHNFFTADRTPAAAADQSLVTVDMTTRRATELPDFLKDAAERR